MEDPQDNGIDWAIVERFLAGKYTRDEAISVRNWSLAHPRLAQLLAVASAGPPSVGARKWQTDAAWEYLRAEQPALSAPAIRILPVAPGRWLMPGMVRAAVGMAVIASALGWWMSLLLGHARQAPPSSAVVAARGQRVTVRLADGSRVILAPETRLTPAVGFGQDNRVVTVAGRVYFDVVHDTVHPFTVVVGGTQVRDVGTAFEVDAYGSTASVIVAHGAVTLSSAESNSSPTTIVSAGQLARIDPSGGATVVPHADVGRWLSWTTGDLEFQDTPLPDALSELERWYDVEIIVADTRLTRRRITGTLHDEPLPLVLRSIGLILHATYQVNGRTITLR
jgi:transmembrane sensor